MSFFGAMLGTMQPKHHFVKVLASAALFAAAIVWAGEEYMGTIAASTTSKNNSTTAVPFVLNNGSLITVQCDADTFICLASTCTAAQGIKMLQDKPYDTSMRSSGLLSAITASGTSNCKVWQRSGTE